MENAGSDACLVDFVIPGNFPFGTPGAAKYYSTETTTALMLAERDNCQRYLNAYFEIFDHANPVVDRNAIVSELATYWRDPNEATLCWLSHILMALGLGCFASANESPVAIEFMMAAEACLMQTSFMFQSTLFSLKTLCLMIVAKQVCNPNCWAQDSCWTLMGILTRAAIIAGLPNDTRGQLNEPEEVAERESRRQLWLTVLYLDIKCALSTGMSPLSKANDMGDIFQQTVEWDHFDTHQMMLFQSLPTVLSVVTAVNSDQDSITYPDTLRYSAQLRELMARSKNVIAHPIQRITIDIFLRRCLMVLQRPFAMHPEGARLFPEAYWTSLECSIALLMHYRDLWCNETGLRLDLVGRSFVMDFFSATLTCYIHLLKAEAPLTDATARTRSVPPRQIILDLLHSCLDIWTREKDRSVTYRIGYDLLRLVLDLIPNSPISVPSIPS